MEKEVIAISNKTDSCFTDDDEINLVDYVLVLWKRRVFILLGTILPAVCVAAGLLLLPRDYTMTYTYDMNVDGKLYNILRDRFYSEENLEKLVGRLQKDGIGAFAAKLSKCARSEDYEKYIMFDTSPPFLAASKSNTEKDPEKLAKIWEMKASLLSITITDNSPQYLKKTASIVRYNFEKMVPVYIAQRQLIDTIRNNNSMLADVESSRFSTELSMKNSNEVLAGLKRINVDAGENKQNSVLLQFDIGGQNQFLPLSYQIQAAESKIVELGEAIKTTEERYNYHKDLMNLNDKALSELNAKISSDYTIEDYKDFLVNLLSSIEKTQIKDYLSSYIRTIENLISSNRPLAERPQIVPAEKGTAKKTAVVFAACLMLSVFSAFVMEGVEKNKARLS